MKEACIRVYLKTICKTLIKNRNDYNLISDYYKNNVIIKGCTYTWLEGILTPTLQPWDREKKERVPCTGPKEKSGRRSLGGTHKKEEDYVNSCWMSFQRCRQICRGGWGQGWQSDGSANNQVKCPEEGQQGKISRAQEYWGDSGQERRAEINV